MMNFYLEPKLVFASSKAAARSTVHPHVLTYIHSCYGTYIALTVKNKTYPAANVCNFLTELDGKKEIFTHL